MAVDAKGTNGPDMCDFCRRGVVVLTMETLRFIRYSDRGKLQCEVTVEIGRCDRCNLAHIGSAGEKVIQAEERRAYLKLPPKTPTEPEDY